MERFDSILLCNWCRCFVLVAWNRTTFYNREIIINKKNKEFIFIVGARRFYSKIKVIRFEKISHIEICASPFESGGEIEAIKDTIYPNVA